MNNLGEYPKLAVDNAEMSGNTYSASDRSGSIRDVDNKMTVTREEIDAKLERGEARLEASESRIAAQLADFKAEFSSIKKSLDHVPSRWSVFGAAFTSAIAVIGIILAVLAFGGDRFDGGVQISSNSILQAAEARRLATENSTKIDALTTSVDDLGGIIRASFEKRDPNSSDGGNDKLPVD